MAPTDLSRFASVDVNELAKDELEVGTITLYQTEGAHRGSLLAVNSEYICYAIKGGMIRVISRTDASRALVRGFDSYAADMALSTCGAVEGEEEADDSEALLAAVGNDGKLLVWELASSDGTLEPSAILRADVGASTTRADLCDRVVWRPSAAARAADEPLLLATVLAEGSQVALWGVRAPALVGSAEQPARTLALPVGAAGAVRDVAFTPDGAALALCLADAVRIFDLSGVSAAGVLEGLAAVPAAYAWLSLPGAALDTVRPVAPGAFLVGADGNSLLELWAQPPEGGACARAASVRLASAAGGFALTTCPPPPPPGAAAADPFAPPLVVLSARASGVVVVASTAARADGSIRFGQVSAFRAALPIVSAVVAVEATGPDEAPELSAFVVQTSAIQRLAFKAAMLPAAHAGADADADADGEDEGEAEAAEAEARVRAASAVASRAPPPAAVETEPPASEEGKPPSSAPSPFLEAALKRLAAGGLPPVPPPTPAGGADVQLGAERAAAAAAAAGGKPKRDKQGGAAGGAVGGAAPPPVVVLARPPPRAPPHEAPAEVARATPSPSHAAATPAAAAASPASAAAATAAAATAATASTASSSASALDGQHGTVMAALQQILNNQKRHEAASLAAIASSEKRLLAELAAAEKRLLAQLGAKTDAAAKAHAARADAAAPALAAALKASLEKQLPALLVPLAEAARAAAADAAQAVGGHLYTQLAAEIREATPTAGASAAALAEPLVGAVRVQFERALIPAVERAVAQAGAQLRGSVEHAAVAAAAAARDAVGAQLGGVSAAVSGGVAAQLSGVAAPIAEQVALGVSERVGERLEQAVGQALGHGLAPLAAQLASLRAAVDAGAKNAAVAAAAAAAASAAAAQPARAQPASPAAPARDARAELKGEVETLRRTGYLEKAFATALSAADRGLVEGLMAAAQPHELVNANDHGASTVASKQIVLISLLQQIGSFLTKQPAAPAAAAAPADGRWPELHARWLADSLMALEPTEPVIAASVPPVLAAVEQSLVATLAMPAAGQAQRQLSIALHVVRSLRR